MSEKPINNLQDKLFRYIFKRKEAALGFFKNYLPEKLVELIVWSSLELESGSFVDEQWRDRYSDLVFSVRAARGQELKLYLLFEHQSTPERFMAIRFLSYRNNLWEQLRVANPGLERLPQVVPVLLYQGTGGWKSGNRLSFVLEEPGELQDVLAPFIGDFEYVLVDLPQLSPEEIKGHIIGRVAMLLMKANREGRIWDAVAEIEPQLVELCQAEDSPELIRRLFRYIFESDSRIDKQGYHDKIMLLKDKQLQESAMSIAEVLRKEGKAEGVEIGAVIGEIRQCQKLLGQPVASKEDLSLESSEVLEMLHAELEKEVQKRLSS